jgi:hypothetical protein
MGLPFMLISVPIAKNDKKPPPVALFFIKLKALALVLFLRPNDRARNYETIGWMSTSF